MSGRTFLPNIVTSTRKTLALLLLTSFCLFWLYPSVATAAETAPQGAAGPKVPVVVLKVEGSIDRSLFSYLEGQLDQAERDGTVVVLQIDSSGTLNQDGVALANKVASLKVPVIAWIGPTPAQARGAAMLLLYASSVAAVAPGSQTGPLYPVDVAKPQNDPTDLLTTVRGWLDQRGKETQLEDLDQALPARRSLDLKITSAVAYSVTGVLNKVDGMKVDAGGQQVELQTRVATTEQQAQERTVDIQFENMGPVKRIAHAMASPTMIYVLLVLGLGCIAFELTQSGIGFAGMSGVLMVALAAIGLWSIPPTSWIGFILLLGGVAAMTADVLMRKLGPLTIVGVVAFGAGSVLSWNSVGDPIQISLWLVGLTIVSSILFYGFALTVALQSRDRLVTAQQGLIGLVGEAHGKLAPEGPVYVKGNTWRGRSIDKEPIAAGTRVRVRGLSGMVLTVSPEPGAEPTGQQEEL